jgi:hypothetical protein
VCKHAALKKAFLFWQSVEDFDANIVHTFLKTQKSGKWSMEMVFIPCINIIIKYNLSKSFSFHSGVKHLFG